MEETDIIDKKIAERIKPYKLAGETGIMKKLSNLSLTAKLALSFISGCTATGTLLFASGKHVALEALRPEMGKMVRDSLETFSVKVEGLEQTSDSNKRAIKDINFKTDQILLILEKSNSKALVEEVRRETERFRNN